MKHVKMITRTPALAEDVTDLSSLISLITFVLSLLGTFTTAAQSLFNGVVAALSTKDSTKNPQQ